MKTLATELLADDPRVKQALGLIMVAAESLGIEVKAVEVTVMRAPTLSETIALTIALEPDEVPP